MYNKDTGEIENVLVTPDKLFVRPAILIDQINRADKEKNPIKKLLILLGL